jgi:hypothetical protein
VITLAAFALVTPLVVAAGVFWPKAENVITGLTHARTENEKAANGPLPGNVLLYEKEFQKSAKYTSPGYYPSLNGAEVGDAQRGAVGIDACCAERAGGKAPLQSIWLPVYSHCCGKGRTSLRCNFEDTATILPNGYVNWPC